MIISVTLNENNQPIIDIGEELLKLPPDVQIGILEDINSQIQFNIDQMYAELED